jgi:hypothetical protein
MHPGLLLFWPVWRPLPQLFSFLATFVRLLALIVFQAIAFFRFLAISTFQVLFVFAFPLVRAGPSPTFAARVFREQEHAHF